MYNIIELGAQNILLDYIIVGVCVNISVVRILMGLEHKPVV
jgi:hypothetical protein